MGKRIIIAGGGTGGHIFPAIAIAQAIRKLEPDTEILFIGARGKMEMEKIPQAGYKIEGIDIAGFNRSSLIKNLGLPFKLLKSFIQVRRIFREFMPDAAIGVGGYSSFPVLRYAQSRSVPSFIHEANAFAGKSNILLGRKATIIFTASDGMEKFFPVEKIRISGNPVRPSIAQSRVTREEGCRAFGLDPGQPIVFVTGGSLGAKGINEAIALAVQPLMEERIQLIWQTGQPFSVQAEEVAAGRNGIWTGPFVTRMEDAYAAADIIVARAGAMTVAELCLVKKPVIFVPFPFAAEDHQTMNARHLENKGAAVMIPDKEARGKLGSAIMALLKDADKRERMGREIGKLAVADADDRVAKEILSYLNRVN